MSKGRLEAIIITIMVLNLVAPKGDTPRALLPMIPAFLTQQVG